MYSTITNPVSFYPSREEHLQTFASPSSSSFGRNNNLAMKIRLDRTRQTANRGRNVEPRQLNRHDQNKTSRPKKTHHLKNTNKNSPSPGRFYVVFRAEMEARGALVRITISAKFKMHRKAKHIFFSSTYNHYINTLYPRVKVAIGWDRSE